MRNNKKTTIAVNCTNGNFRKDDIQRIIKLACLADYYLIYVNIDIRKLTNGEDQTILAALFRLVKDLRKENDCVILMNLIINSNDKLFRLIQKNKYLVDSVGIDSSTWNLQKTPKVITTLRKNGVQCYIYLDTNDYQLIKDYYRKYVIAGFPIKANRIADYKHITITDVKNWIYDATGTSLNIYTDIINRALLNYSNDCSFSSCIGNNLYLDDAKISLCCYNNCLCNNEINSCNKYSDIFSSEAVVAFLKKTIANREKCKSECQYFDICRGGCPNKSIEYESCEYSYYFSLISEVRKEINDIIRQGDVSEINPYVRNTIFLGMASYKE